ncbi:MAG: TetR/AcrR family transcriptional regulator [Leptospiraceae bacterium]
MSPATDSRTRMIEGALDLFHRQGVNATSVDQILAASNTGKSQFSYYFKNKDGLILAVLQYLHELIRSGQTPTGYDINTWDEFDHWFQQYIDFQRSVDFQRSCPLGTIGTDIPEGKELLRQEVQSFLEWSRGRLSRFFAERKAADEMVPGVDPDSLADFCISIMHGGMLLTKMKRSSDMFEHAAFEALNYIRSLRKTRV